MREMIEKQLIITDVHMHSEHSHDSECLLADISATAEKKGVDIVCITDHCDIEFCDEIDVEDIIAKSIADAKLHNQNSKVEILSGVEIGEAIWNTQAAEKIVALEGLDQIIGSVHAVRYAGYTQPYSAIDFSIFTEQELAAYLEAYFDDVLEMAATAEFDILAHLTCPLRYINGKYARGVDCHAYQDKIEKILSHIIKREIALEVNTSTCGSKYNEFMPEEWIVKLYKDMGGQLVTCGSDAHVAENIAHEFGRLYNMLIKCGFHEVCYFKDRKIHKCSVL